MNTTRRAVLFGGSASIALLVTEGARACTKTKVTTNCGTFVPQVKYSGGGVEVKVYPATACFTNEIAHAITLQNGYVEFVAAFVYNPDKQTHERIKTVKKKFKNRRDVVAEGGPSAKSNLCWTHNVSLGTYMSVWVTCRTYTGWVAGQFTGDPNILMVPRPDWTWKPKWL